jgi:hypothetical protein
MWKLLFVTTLLFLLTAAQPTSLGPVKQYNLELGECPSLANSGHLEGDIFNAVRTSDKNVLGVKLTGIGNCSCANRDVRECRLVLASSGGTGGRHCEMRSRRFCKADLSYRPLLAGPPPMCSMADLSGSFRRADGMMLRVSGAGAAVSADPAGRWTAGLPKVSGIAHQEGCSFTASCHSLRMSGGAVLGTSPAACTLEFDKETGTMTLSGTHGSFVRQGAATVDLSIYGQ